MLQARLHGKPLADLCHRLAISAESGIDIRRTWEREATNASGSRAQAYAAIRDGVSKGDTLTESLARTGGLFPRLFREMVDVGEKTGSLAEVFHRLSEHYLQQHKMGRDLLAGLMWPIIQLIIAVGVVGLLLAVFATLSVDGLNGKPIDLIGIGVTGWDAVSLYVQFIIGSALVILGLIVAIKQGILDIAPVQRWIMYVPQLGPCIEKVCLARLTWVLHLTLNVEMDLRRIVPLALRATGSNYYSRWSKPITDLVAGGLPLYEAFATAAIFPQHFIDSLQVAEESGQVVESMSRLSAQYQDESQSAMKTLTVLLGVAIGLGIAVLIGAVIIRFFMMYVGILNDAQNF